MTRAPRGAEPAPDTSVFPEPSYRDAVLAPLFEGVRAHYADHMAAVDRAHLVMLADTGILDPDRAREIGGALAAIEREIDPAELVYTGEHEDWFFVVEAELERRLGPDVGGMLHTARSRNDIDHTIFRMAARTRTDALLERLVALGAALADKARSDRDVPIVAYTHGQPAQPSTFGHYLCAVLEVVLSDLERLLAARAALDLCPMGAAAITTTGFPIDRARVAELLGFVAPKRNGYGCIASVDYVTGLYSALKLAFLHLGRVFQDMAFWSAFEVGQLFVPDSLVQVSSIMPQKRNPVPIEHLRHLSSMTCGRCDAIVNAMHNTPFTDMNDSEGEVQAAGYAAFDSGTRVLALARAFFASVSIDGARVRANADAACVTITELADTLVREEGLSFRRAHEVAAATARAVIAARAPLAEGFDAFAGAFADAVGRPPSLGSAAFAEAVSTKAFVARRDRFGGPAPAALDEALERYDAELDAFAARVAEGPARIRAAEVALCAAFAPLAVTGA